ncbi:MAG: helix-turn-helix domain-containing protein, partial [Cyanobacteria bacterium]|nr:helix-turn-helix domain-containing protein [Cyanobacteria bacterium bin.275]
MAGIKIPLLNPSPLNPSSQLPPTRLRGGLGRWLGRKPRSQPAAAPEPELDPLLAAGRQLRQRREERGLSLRQLALDTRVSAAVLEAMERGWPDRLPEATYLRTMLPLIERHLDLPSGCLDPMLARGNQQQARQQRQGDSLRFTPGSIDVFTTWQGTVLYGVLTLALVYGLNLQQQKIASQGLL